MPISNYPAGFPMGVTIRGVPVTQLHSGKVFWCGNNSSLLIGEKGASDSNNGSYLAPFSTLAYALTQVVAGRGDIVVLKPGFVCTVISATQLAIPANTAVIGLGSGDYRATINLTTGTTSKIAFSGAGASMANVLVTGGIDAIVSPIVVSAADITLQDVEYRDVTGKAILGVLTTAAANRLLIERFFFNGAAAAAATAAIAIVGGDAIEIKDFFLYGNFSVSAIDIRTTATTRLRVKKGTVHNLNASCVCVKDTITASTGYIGPDLYFQLLTNAANITEAATGATFVYFPSIYVVNLAGEQAMVINITASTDA